MTVDTATRDRPRGATVLLWLVGVAFVVSVIHYVDNVANYDAYPQPGPDELPAPSAGLIGASWFVFTLCGVLGVIAFFRHRRAACVVGLVSYSFSGLIGIGHYTVEGATDMVWWRQTHVVVDIVVGISLLAFAAWVAVVRPAPWEPSHRG
ncbi:hypothetical protein KV100_15975 [Mumia sp. zg.B21]|uniref:hypothetical protein n=1 Tax=unclassified Mumia TaxID=2621872 RepID=UPI001C6EF5B9|nr:MULTISPECIES: hypothetical protein [unclassified Mumia]MBW9211155.1 hypothetical protein [Mumia sp. zg.B21]MDD9348144.1 hypothetical protein [Mumia sp.]